MEATIKDGRFIGWVFLNFTSTQTILDCVFPESIHTPYIKKRKSSGFFSK